MNNTVYMNDADVREISNYRAEKLLNLSPDTITRAVFRELGNAGQALQGVDYEADGLTKTLWEQAITTAEMTDDLVRFRSNCNGDCFVLYSFGGCVTLIAERVAAAILAVHGMA